ncbi:MAG: hypothetical protein C0614_02640 [Desulfuromonas sp.]|nr:MAG: hypothetical protein C0614_02640 [Desulfuromonas sp.]
MKLGWPSSRRNTRSSVITESLICMLASFQARLLAIVLILTLVSGCAGINSGSFSWRDEAVDLTWPPPPDLPRIGYLRSFHGPTDFRTKDGGRGLLTWLLGERQDELPLLSPFAVAATASGLVWVADNGSRMLYRFDVNRRRVEYFQELGGLRLFSPNGLAVDETGQRLFLSDAGLDRVLVLDQQGRLLDRWGPQQGFSRPVGLAYDPQQGRLLVADAMGGQVFVYDSQGRELLRLGSRVNADGRFARPLAVDFGPNGEILVLDALSFRVEVLDGEGDLLTTIGQVGDAAGFLARPKGLAVNAQGHVFISDSAFDNIQVFDMAGNLLMYWGSAGSGLGQFNMPAGLFVDAEGRLFVADWYNHRVQVFESLKATE